MPILWWNSQEAQTPEDERAGNLFLPTRKMGRGRVSTTIPPRTITDAVLWVGSFIVSGWWGHPDLLAG